MPSNVAWNLDRISVQNLLDSEKQHNVYRKRSNQDNDSHHRKHGHSCPGPAYLMGQLLLLKRAPFQRFFYGLNLRANALECGVVLRILVVKL